VINSCRQQSETWFHGNSPCEPINSTYTYSKYRAHFQYLPYKEQGRSGIHAIVQKQQLKVAIYLQNQTCWEKLLILIKQDLRKPRLWSWFKKNFSWSIQINASSTKCAIVFPDSLPWVASFMTCRLEGKRYRFQTSHSKENRTICHHGWKSFTEHQIVH